MSYTSRSRGPTATRARPSPASSTAGCCAGRAPTRARSWSSTSTTSTPPCRRSSRSAGQTLIGRQAVGDMGWAAYFKDVEGNSMGLWQSAVTPDRTRLPPMLPPSDRRACIIGAGSSGITAAQVLDARGIPFDCFEMGSGVGGNWRYDNDNGVSSAYRSLHINTSRHAMEYAAYPMPETLPDYPSHWQIADYFDDYVDHFGLREQITFRTEVVKVVPAAGRRLRRDGAADGRRAPRAGGPALRPRAGRQRPPLGPALARARASRAARPSPAQQVHAHYYRTPDLLEGKRVVVLGIGNSATDIAVESSRVARETYLAMRRGAYIVPKFIFGRPTDHLTDSPLARGPFAAAASGPWRDAAAVGRQGHRLRPAPARPRRARGPPDRQRRPAHPARARRHHRQAEPSTGSRASKVFFADGTAVEADVVVYCTGYKVSFPFLAEEILRSDDNHVDLYRRVVSPRPPRPLLHRPGPADRRDHAAGRGAGALGRRPDRRRRSTSRACPRCGPRSRRTTRRCAGATSPRSGTPSRSTSTSTAPSSAGRNAAEMTRPAADPAESAVCIRGIHTAYPSPRGAVDSPIGGAGCRSGRHCWRCWSRGRCTATSSGRSSSSGPGRPGRSTSGRSTRP